MMSITALVRPDLELLSRVLVYEGRAVLTVELFISVGRDRPRPTVTPVRSAASTICSADWSRMRWHTPSPR